MAEYPAQSPPQRFTLALLSLCSAFPAHALVFNLGQVDAQLDTTLSFDTRLATGSRQARLIGAANGGHGHSQSGDDGRLNFHKSQLFTQRLEATHALELRRDDTGLFIRGRYWYDFVLKNENLAHTNIDDSGRKMLAKSAGQRLLDAFIYQHYQWHGQPGTLRFGAQVVRWGESHFIGNGLDAINPHETVRLVNPATELREAAIPVNLLYVSQQLNQRWLLDAFYQLDWEQDILPNCGTFFSMSDGMADGCNRYDVGQAAAERLPRAGDQDARNAGQFGLALHRLGDRTEVGVYALNYHSRQGMFGTRNRHYRLAYPEDIHLYGLSVATWLPTGSRWASELSYRPNAPLQLNTAQLVQHAWQTDKGYRRKAITQLQSSLSHEFDRPLGADQLSVLGELGYVHVSGLERQTRYGRDPVFGLHGRQGFVTSDAWGYRLRATAHYRNIWPRIELHPSLAFSHDVNGYGPNGLFQQGAKAVSVGLGLSYMGTYDLNLTYTNFFAGRYNTWVDRDFLGVNLSAHF